MSIEALIEYIKLYKKGDVTLEARKQLLISQKDVIKERLEEIQNTFDRINYKIKNYEKILVEREKDLLKKKNKK